EGAALVERQLELGLDRRRLGACEAHRDEDEVGRQLPLRARPRDATPVDVLRLRDAERAHLAARVPEELDGRGEEDSLAALLVGARDLEDLRRHGPRLVAGTLERRLLADRK